MLLSPLLRKKNAIYYRRERDSRKNQRSSLCLEYGIPESRMRGWIDDENKLREAFSNIEAGGNKRKRIKGANEQEMDQTVFTWFTQARSAGIQISPTNIQIKPWSFTRCCTPTTKMLPYKTLAQKSRNTAIQQRKSRQTVLHRIKCLLLKQTKIFQNSLSVVLI